MSAILSPDRRHRYLLRRPLSDVSTNHALRKVLWVMLNPSTADEEADDATIRACRRFSEHWGYDEFVAVNLYGFRATRPADLWKAADTIGAENDHWIGVAASDPCVRLVVAAWGNHAQADRARNVLALLPAKKLRCLGTNRNGTPKHPLYLATGTKLVAFTGVAP